MARGSPQGYWQLHPRGSSRRRRLQVQHLAGQCSRCLSMSAPPRAAGADGLDEDGVQLSRHFERHRRQRVGLLRVVATQNLVRRLLGDVQSAQASRRAPSPRWGEEVRRDRCSIVTCSAWPAIAGITVAAVAPEPMMTRRLPARSSPRATVRGASTGLDRDPSLPVGLVRPGVGVVARAHPQQCRRVPQYLSRVDPS